MADEAKLERGPMVGRMLEGDFEKDTITFHMPATYYLASGRYIIEPEGDWLRRKDELTRLQGLEARVKGAPVMWAGVGPNGWLADSGFKDRAEVVTVMSGWGSEEEKARITTTRVALLALGGEGVG